jgi:hypothetical protein
VLKLVANQRGDTLDLAVLENDDAVAVDAVVAVRFTEDRMDLDGLGLGSDLDVAVKVTAGVVVAALLAVEQIEQRIVGINLGVGQCRQPDLFDFGREGTLAGMHRPSLRGERRELLAGFNSPAWTTGRSSCQSSTSSASRSASSVRTRRAESGSRSGTLDRDDLVTPSLLRA